MTVLRAAFERNHFFMLTLNSKIEEINKVGPAYLKKLHRLKIATIRDLLFHFPHRYEDFSQIMPISEVKRNEKITVRGKIKEIENRQAFRKRMSLTEAVIEDDTGAIKSVWFNQPYLTKTLKRGRIVNLSGKTSFKKELFLSNPIYEIAGSCKNTTHTGRLVPVYHETEKLSSRYLRYLIRPLLSLAYQINDFLPWQIKKEYQLMDAAQAIKQIHFPGSLEASQKARQRLAFDELFLIQMTTLLQKQKLTEKRAIKIPFEQETVKLFVKNLPFKLTNDQRIAAWEVFQDIQKDKPMNRLLNGDVGSGKTMVAIMASLSASKAKCQTALMAPTEVLAKQHFQTFNNFLKKKGSKIVLLTGADARINTNKKNNKESLKKAIKEGQANIIIGTHALIQEDISFKKLALAIVDEQHRFGVAQRAALQKSIYHLKDGMPAIPHLLSMTATPIPRTLALTLYGDLDISLIKQMPKGRQKIITRLISPRERESAYQFIAQQIKNKRQAFIICPLVEESKKLEAKSATQEYERLAKEVFPNFKLALLHGRLRVKEKEEIMEKFKKGRIDILVSTSVVEVGVDIPNAAIMVIENADRFGLAQLHQFRGRVGRGKHQSYCLLFANSDPQGNTQRLRALVKSQDGFKLAEKDLKIRGPGEFTGIRQWGAPNLIMASLNDLELIKKSRQAASQIIERDLINSSLRQKISQFQQNIHLE